jgi:hypothetical protein
MKLPPVVTEVKDTANRVLWRIRAYRAVTEPEARMAIATYAQQHGTPKPNKMVEIITVIGFQD